MSFLDKIKGLVGKNADKVEDGLDKGADFVKDTLPDEHDGKVDRVVDAATDMLEKVDGDEESSAD